MSIFCCSVLIHYRSVVCILFALKVANDFNLQYKQTIRNILYTKFSEKA